MKRYGAAFLPVFSMVAVLFSTQVLYAEIPSLEPPRVVTFRINGGQEKTGNRTVTLDFVAERASQFRASERPDFSSQTVVCECRSTICPIHVQQ